MTLPLISSRATVFCIRKKLECSWQISVQLFMASLVFWLLFQSAIWVENWERTIKERCNLLSHFFYDRSWTKQKGIFYLSWPFIYIRKINYNFMNLINAKIKPKMHLHIYFVLYLTSFFFLFLIITIRTNFLGKMHAQQEGAKALAVKNIARIWSFLTLITSQSKLTRPKIKVTQIQSLQRVIFVKCCRL